MNIIKEGYKLFASIVKWLHKEFQESATNFMRDVRSIRVLWNWLFLMLFTWEAVWLVLYHGDKAGGIVVTVTGGIVTAVFTNYVWSSYFEKKNDVARKRPTESGDEDGSA